MNTDNAAHRDRIIARFSTEFSAKYERGQAEHGGNMWEKPGMLSHAIEEVLDLAAYLYTLDEQGHKRPKTVGGSVFLPDERDVTLSRYGYGNKKIGPSVYTYSRLPGRGVVKGTCPGSTVGCEAICYAKRIAGPVRSIHSDNSERDDVPPIPDACRLLRIHVSGDFDTVAYVDAWVSRLEARPDVTAWAYTRSWRVPSLVPALERLRALPNMQLFASMDDTTPEDPPDGWRVAWIAGDRRIDKAIQCPEQTGDKSSCEACGYCLVGRKGGVVFARH